jgi:hypothetical protein
VNFCLLQFEFFFPELRLFFTLVICIVSLSAIRVAVSRDPINLTENDIRLGIQSDKNQRVDIGQELFTGGFGSFKEFSGISK